MLVSVAGGSFVYRRKQPVLENVSLQFETGRHILLGPNGAGKSTLLGVLAGVLPLSQGVVMIDGSLKPTDKAYVAAVSWMQQKIYSFPRLRTREQVAYIGWLKGMAKSQAWDSAELALQRVNLSRLAESPVHQLSGGQLRRLGIAGALVHNASIMLLDEPTVGLDPAQRKSFQELLDDLQHEKTIVISTHLAGDIDGGEASISVLDQGRVQFTGTPQEFLLGENGHTSSVEDAYSRFVSAD